MLPFLTIKGENIWEVLGVSNNPINTDAYYPSYNKETLLDRVLIKIYKKI